MKLNILVVCECSNIAAQAFRDLGHRAISVDTQKNEVSDEHHYQCKIEDFFADSANPQSLYMPEDFHMMLAHPDCTYMTNAGARWLWLDRAKGIKDEERWEKMREAAAFFNYLWRLPIKHKALENPVMVGYAMALLDAGKQSQSVQPYHFGTMTTKRTCWWLDNLPKAKATNDVKAETMALPYGQRAKCHYASPGAGRRVERSRSDPNMMQALAKQWADYLVGQYQLT